MQAAKCSPATRSAGPTCCAARWARRSRGDGEAARTIRQRLRPGEQDSARRKPNQIFDILEKFAGYGFNKSHSAAYAIVSYQTAYLKANYPVEFMAANLSVEIGNNERLAELIAECQEMDIDIQPPSVNESGVRFTPVGPPGQAPTAIRFGLAGVKNVGTVAVETVVKNREERGPFQGLLEFCGRVDTQAVNRKMLESLVRCGAFDFTSLPRSRLFAGVEFAMKRAQSAQSDVRSGQASLFDLMSVAESSAPHSDNEFPAVEPWPASQDLTAEKELLGFYISGHPLTAYARTLARYNSIDPKILPETQSGTPMRMGGLVTQLAKKFTKKEEAMAVFRLEHLEGSLEVVVFPSAYRDYGVHLREDAPVLVGGEFERNEQQLKLKVSEIYPLGEAHKHFAQKVSIHLPATRCEDDKFRELKNILRKNPGETPVVICIEYPGGQKVFIDTDRTFKVSASEQLAHEIEHLLGEGTCFIGVNPAPVLKARSNRPWERPAAATRGG